MTPQASAGHETYADQRHEGPPEERKENPAPYDMVQEVSRRLAQAWTFDRINREEGIIDLKFLAGDQWPEYARSARQNRPMLTINKLPQFLHQVTNDIRQNAPVIKVTPVDGKNDPNLAKVYDGIINDIQYRSSAKHVYAQAAYHAAACGIGHWRIITKYADDQSFDQEIAIEPIPYPFAVYWDPAAVKPDRSDAMWCIVAELVPRETFKARYPGADQTSIQETLPNNYSQGLFWNTRDYVVVGEYWCKHPTMRTITAFQSGETYDTTDYDMQELYMLQMQHGPVEQQRKARGYRLEQSLVTGAQVLSGPNHWPGRHIPIVPVIGEEVPLERQIIRHGLIRMARDPQSLYNFYRSAAAEHIALGPKSPWLVTDAMIQNYIGEWNNANIRNTPYLRYDPDPDASGSGGKPERVQAPQPPEAMWREAQIATDDIKSTTGIYDASLGAKSNETSGVAIKQRERQGDTANFHFADNLSRSLEHSGRILVDLIPKIYDNQRIVRMVGEDESEQFVPINHELYTQNGERVLVNDLSSGRFDVRVTIGPSYATKRLEAAQAITELMGVLPDPMKAVLADIAVRNMDIPDAQEAAKRIKAMLPPQAMHDPDQPPPPPPNPMDDPAFRADFELKQAQARKTYAEARKAELEASQLEMAGVSPEVQETEVVNPHQPVIDHATARKAHADASKAEQEAQLAALQVQHFQPPAPPGAATESDE